MFLDGLRDRLGRRKGLSVWNDLRQSARTPRPPVSVDGRFPYAKLPRRTERQRDLDNGSFRVHDASRARRGRRAANRGRPATC